MLRTCLRDLQSSSARLGLGRRALTGLGRDAGGFPAAAPIWRRVAMVAALEPRPSSVTNAFFSKRHMSTNMGETRPPSQPAENQEPNHAHAPPPPPPPPFFKDPIGWLKGNKAHFKDLFKRYGYLTVATYLTVYVITLAGLYGCVRLGLVDGPDVNGFINDMAIKKALVGDKHVSFPPKFIDFGTAWVMTKMTEPIRLAVTIAIMPQVVKRAPASVLKFFKAAVANAPAKAASTTAASTSSSAAASAAGNAAGKLK